MKRMRRKKLSLAVVKSVSAGAAVSLVAPLAYGQQPAPSVEKLQRVLVTGSLIPLRTLESESPVNIISAQDIAYTGLTNISDILNQLPSVTADLGNMEANGASGTATVNLRHLGPSRTLVLIDGRRVPPNNTSVDLNQIPAPLIQRVDVLTGGASSIYGSDAVAGVVNFIMNDHFEGVQLSWNGNDYNHQQHDSSGVSSAVAARSQTNPSQFQVPGNVGLDGQVQDISFILGSNFASGKGNATVYFEYKKAQPVLQGSRDFSACTAGTNDAGTDFVCGGSSTSYPGRFFNVNTGQSLTIANSAGDVRPFNPATDLFNIGPQIYFQVPDERYITNFFAHYDAFPNVRVYTEFDFMNSTTVLQFAQSGSFFGRDTYTLYDSNPLLSPAFKTAFGITPTTPGALLIGRRNVEGGARQPVPDFTYYRIVIGAKGELLDGKWDYDVWWQSGKVISQGTFLNDLSRPKIINSLNVVTNPANGQPVCASVLDGSDPSCVPWDIFHSGGVTQAAVNYLQTPGLSSAETFQNVLGLHVNSDLGEAYGWRLPWAKSGIGVALGVEHRTEKLSTNLDEFFQVPLGAGVSGAGRPVSGQYTVNELFGEIRIPIIEKMPFVEALNFNASYRYSNYTTGPTTNTYGLGAEWLPVKGVRLRGTYQQAARAPNIVELFSTQSINLFSMGADPCGPTKSATLAQCLQTGLKTSQYGQSILDDPLGQYQYLQGGNPNLKPETAKSYTIGTVLQPIAGLNATIDYWNIRVTNAVGVIAPTLALNQCLQSGQFCDLIHRDPNFGTLWLAGGFITGTNLNLATYKTDGIDVTVNWSYPFEKYGSLVIKFIGTWLNQFIVEPVPGFGSYDCAGLYGNTCGVPLPIWRSRLQAIWSTPWNWNFGATWRYFSSVSIDQSSTNPLLVGAYDPKVGNLGARGYLDLVAQWNINKNFTVRGGVNNAFDRDPPITTIGNLPYFNGNTYPQTYDALGRNVFLNVTAKF